MEAPEAGSGRVELQHLLGQFAGTARRTAERLGHRAAEQPRIIDAVLGRGLSVLEIHDFISGEFEPVPLQDVWDFVKAQETAGAVKLTTKPAGK